MPADFGLLQQPSFAAAALGGYQAGQAIGRQKRLDSALQGVDFGRPETLLPVLQADPQIGSSLLNASAGMVQAQQAAAKHRAIAGVAQVLADRGTAGGVLSGGGTAADTPGPAPVPAQASSPPGTIPQAPAGAPGTPTTGSDPSDVTVTGPSRMDQAMHQLASDAPEEFFSMQSSLAQLDKDQRARLDAANEHLGGAVEAARQMPYEQRRAYIQAQRSQLIGFGVPAEQIDGFDPTDTNIAGIETQVLGVKGALEHRDKMADQTLARERFTEDQRQHGIENGLSAQRVGLEGAQVGIARGHLAIAQHADARAAVTAKAKATGGGGTIATPTNAAEYNALPSGARYYKNGTLRIKQ